METLSNTFPQITGSSPSLLPYCSSYKRSDTWWTSMSYWDGSCAQSITWNKGCPGILLSKGGLFQLQQHYCSKVCSFNSRANGTAQSISFQGVQHVHAHFCANSYGHSTSLTWHHSNQVCSISIPNSFGCFTSPCCLLSPWPSHLFVQSDDDLHSDSVGSQSQAGSNPPSTQALTSAVTISLFLALTVSNASHFPCLWELSSACHSHPLHLSCHQLLLFYNISAPIQYRSPAPGME